MLSLLMGTSRGAAGSVIVLLLWVYYSSLIIFVGAEIASLRMDETESNLQVRQPRPIFHLFKQIPRWVLASIVALVVIRVFLPPACLWAINTTLEKKLQLTSAAAGRRN